MTTVEVVAFERRSNHGPIPVRLPWAPLVPFVEHHLGDEAVCHGRAGQNGPKTWTVGRRRGIADFARIHGFHRAALHRWKRGGVTVGAADRLADALGRHPFDIWGSAYHAAILLLGDENRPTNYASCPTCGRDEVGVHVLTDGTRRLFWHHELRKGTGRICAGSHATVEASR